MLILVHIFCIVFYFHPFKFRFYLGAQTTEYFGFGAKETKFFDPETFSTKIISVECRHVCQNQIFINFNTINSFILVLQSMSSHSTLNRVKQILPLEGQNLATILQIIFKTNSKTIKVIKNLILTFV